MLLWALAAVAALAIAALQYWWGGAPPRRAAAPAALRTGALTFLLAALLDAPLGRARAPEALVALDASASWRRGGDTLAWREARTRAGGRGGDSLVLFGDSARGTRSAPGTPSDAASRVRPAVERAVAAGRPIVVVTDGEIDDPDALRRLPAGSRVEVVPRAARPDGALAALDAPRAAVGGDTLTARVTLVAGAAGAPAGELRLAVADRQLAAAAVDALPPYGERAVELRGRVAAPEGPAILRATFVAAADAEPRNDTLAVSLDVSRAAAAVFVSSSPDFDARFALAVLRGALAVPARGYYRVAPGQWRREGTLAPVPER